MDFGSPGFAQHNEYGHRGSLRFSSSSSSSSSNPHGKNPIWDEPVLQNQPPRAAEAMEDDGGRGDYDGLVNGGIFVEKEHMFDKVVTPSDVGKLNRLVIPKQHAERYFPLDPSTNEKGLILNFEDHHGKSWRFRYSYWTSSQSYVMTKGWSRFVKEKRLDAGDIVSFQRGVSDGAKDRFYIDSRRRPELVEPLSFNQAQLIPTHFQLHPWSGHSSLMPPVGVATPLPVGLLHTCCDFDQSLMSNRDMKDSKFIRRDKFSIDTRNSESRLISNNVPYNVTGGSYGYGGGTVVYLGSTAPPALLGRSETEPIVIESVPVAHRKAAGKRLRLFGVNMECPISESDELSETHVQFIGRPMKDVPTDFLEKGKSSSDFGI